MKIYCCKCKMHIEARLTNGKEVYPHRDDLHALPFWKCDICGNFVGCHYKTENKTRPLGNIPFPALKKARMEIHKILDPIWQSGKLKRCDLYNLISTKLSMQEGYQYHTAMLPTIEDARKVYRIILDIRKKIGYN